MCLAANSSLNSLSVLSSLPFTLPLKYPTFFSVQIQCAPTRPTVLGDTGFVLNGKLMFLKQTSNHLLILFYVPIMLIHVSFS